MLYTFTPNKLYGYLLNVEPSNLVFLKTYNTEFHDITVIFDDQNSGPLEIEDNIYSIVLTHSANLRPNDVQKTSPKNILTSSERPHMVLFVTPWDASVAGRPWDVPRTSI